MQFKYPFEFCALLALILFLPSFEAPKNLFCFVFVLIWIVNRLRARDFGGRWDSWDSLIAIWMLSGFIVAAFAGLHDGEWRGAVDIVRYVSVLWLVKRSRYGARELVWLLAAVAISTLIALSMAAWQLSVTHTKYTLELNSVGQVNHSAIYLAISYGALLSGVLAFWRRLNAIWRLLATLLVGIFAAAVVVSASRAAVGAMLLLTLFLGLAWLRRSRLPLAVLVLALATGSAVAYSTRLAVVQKQERFEQKNNVLSSRDLIWNGAFVVWKEFPVFGIGMDNYHRIDVQKIRDLVEASGESFDASKYLMVAHAHAHSLYMHTLVERGIFGLAVVLAILLMWIYRLMRLIPKKGDQDIAWALWGGSVSAWIITVVVGFVNTTLHHEHAILSVLLLGMWLAFLQQKSNSKS